MTMQNRSAIAALIIIIAIALVPASLHAESISLGAVIDQANTPVFRGTGTGGEIRISTTGPVQVYASQSLGLHNSHASVMDSGSWVPIRAVSDMRRIYFAATAIGVSAMASGSRYHFGMDAGLYFADRWYCLAGYRGNDWGRMSVFTAGALVDAVFEKQVIRDTNGWLFLRLGCAFEAWTFSVKQERIDRKRTDGPWIQEGMGGAAFTGACGFRCFF